MTDILWINSKPNPGLTHFLEKSAWQSLQVTTAEVAFSQVQMESVCIIIWSFLDDSLNVEAENFLKRVSQLSPRPVILMDAPHLTTETVKHLINLRMITRFLEPEIQPENLQKAVEDALRISQKRLEEARLLTERKTQNRKLIDLTVNLEKLVQERTVNIENATLEAEYNLNRVRRLVKFIKKLSKVTTLEELVSEFRQEVKKTHGYGEPLIAVDVGDVQWLAFFYSGGQVTAKPCDPRELNFSKIRYNSVSDQKFVAELFRRPSMRIISFPIQAISSATNRTSYIFVEHQLSDEQLDQAIGDLHYLLQTFAVVLERLLVEEELLRSSYQWESTFANVPAPIAVIDGAYSITRGNLSFYEGNKGVVCHSVFANRREPCVGCPVFQVLASGKPQSSQVTKEGKVYEVHSYPISVSGSLKVTHVVNYYLDVTRQREIYGDLIQSEKISAVGLLAGNIAHELNNPLTGLKSMAQVISRDLQSEDPIAKDLFEVERAAGRCEGIIKNLLDFASPKRDQVLEKVELDALIDKTMPMLKTAFRNHRTQFELKTKGSMVLADPQLLQQVIFNLINNACQAMETAGVLTVETQLSESSIELRISDTGPGIPSELVDVVFEPFFTTKAEGKGTGLGLSISKSIVEKFGGSISLKTSPAMGSQFTIVLPLARGV